MSEKKYVIDNKKLMSEWDWEKNNALGLNPKTLTLGSNKKASWKCSKSHVWEAKIINRAKGQGCPYCSSHKVLKGFNDLETKAPHLAREWNYAKNTNLNPSDIFPSSNKKVWWICEYGHEWEDTPNHRFNRNDGCPYCSGHKIEKGFNDLTKTHPLLVKEWNYERNGTLNPSGFSQGSGKKVWWKCYLGHEWQATISSRSRGNGCPICKKEIATSYPEQIIYYYIKRIFLDTINRYVENKRELDIFIPSKKIGIEYDGMFYHDESKRHKEIEKDNYFLSQNILVIRIKEKKGLSQSYVENNTIYYSPNNVYKNIHQPIQLLIEKIFDYIGDECPQLQIDLEKDNESILQSFLSTLKENSIINNPILEKQWNYEKNGSLNPQYFPINSGKKVWWKCENGHEWQAVIASRNSGHNCPYCSNQKILPGYNDLQSKFPELAKEWHPTKNGSLLPNNVPIGSNKKVWWKCKNGHEWQANIQPRTKGVGCPYCSNQKIMPGYNDLQSKFPELAKEWHPTKNGTLKPNMVSCGSGKIVWWKCKNGHEWQAIIKNRSKGYGCPICRKETPKKTTNKRILVYDAHNKEFYGAFEDARAFCKYFNLDYEKKKSQISAICKGRQKTLMGKYILKYDNN